jgi:hypothetical protein
MLQAATSAVFVLEGLGVKVGCPSFCAVVVGAGSVGVDRSGRVIVDVELKVCVMNVVDTAFPLFPVRVAFGGPTFESQMISLFVATSLRLKGNLRSSSFLKRPILLSFPEGSRQSKNFPSAPASRYTKLSQHMTIPPSVSLP